MARIVDSLPSGSSGRTAKYPWDEWTDGQAREVLQGEDYTCKHSAFRVRTYALAKDRHLKVSFRVLKADGEQVGWTFQFSPNGGQK